MNEYIIPIAIFLIAIIAFLIAKFKGYTTQAKIQELVAWGATNNSNKYRLGLHLHEYLANAQHKLLDEYHLSAEGDWIMAQEIVVAFQTHLIEQFFVNELYLPSKKHELSGETFFMFHFQVYLNQHQCDSFFLAHEMHQNTIAMKNYGSWGGPTL